MASVEHCLYCFETLAARLEDRTPLTLSEVQKSWAEYARSSSTIEADDTADDSGKLAKRLPALTRVTEASSSSSSASSASNSTLSLNPDTPGTSTSSIPAEAEDNDDTDPALPLPITEFPLFVTWNAFSTRHSEYHLRGCIGTFEAQPIEHGLSSYAIISALEDTRFHPISTRELPSLEVAVTLLTDFEDADDEMDWELGTHGLRISFVYHGRRYGATYLPDVATEQGWTKEETLVSLMRKAGWVGKKERWNEVPLNVVRYQGKKQTVEYAEFKKWRDWVDAQ